MSSGVGRRRGSDPALLWLWRRLAATAPIGPLAWEPLYAVSAAIKRQKKFFFFFFKIRFREGKEEKNSYLSLRSYGNEILSLIQG